MVDKIAHFGDNVCPVWYVVLVLLCGLSVWASGKINYCSSKMCSHTNAHTFCQYSEGPGLQCTGYIEAPLSNQEKARVLTRLNQRRAAAASGRLRRFPTAGNMLKLLWIEELAREAQLWADQCEPPKIPEENDACRDLYSVSVGQCVASVVGEAPGLRPESMVDMWYMQNRHYTGNVIQYEPPLKPNVSYYGDFAQLVYAKTYMVGCGRSRFMVAMHGRLRSVERLVCNFAPRGPIAGRPLWLIASPGTDCPPRSQPDDAMPALCSIRPDIDESLDQDNLMSLEEHVLIDTIFDIEKNESLNYMGSLDEIYLTKVAIATMGPDAEMIPTDIISMQKRDLIDGSELAESIVANIREMEDTQSLNTTTELITINTLRPVLKPPKEVKKGKLIGRPKSYKIEDLSYDRMESKTTENFEQMEDLPNTGTSLDVDYEFVENVQQRSVSKRSDINSTTVTVATVTEVVVTETTTVLENHVNNTNTESTLKETEETTTQLSTTKLMQFNVTYSEEASAKTPSINDTDALLDEYLNDPETFRQLQEELERMEQSISTELSSTERSDKVRRDLRNQPIDVSNGTEDSENSSRIHRLAKMFQEEEQNRTASGTPMLNMVMQYMPYLKDYKNGFLKRAVGQAFRSVHSNFILALTILVFIVL